MGLSNKAWASGFGLAGLAAGLTAPGDISTGTRAGLTASLGLVGAGLGLFARRRWGSGAGRITAGFGSKIKANRGFRLF